MQERSWGIGSIGLSLTPLMPSSMQRLERFRTWLRPQGLRAGVCLSLLALSGLASALEPERARQYKAYLRSQALVVWGLDAPLPLFAGQIHQESGWNPEARSAYACGLTQFTPETAEWIAEQYRVEVGKGECNDARWAIRAMLRYDKHLSDKVKGRDECSNRRFMLSAYNGGLGWVVRDRNKALAAGFNPNDYDQVSPFNAGRGAAFFAENRTYPERIIKHQLHYISWGGPITCKEKIGHVRQSKTVVRYEPSTDPWRCAGVDRLVCKLATLRNRP